MSFAQTLSKIMNEKNITAYRLSKKLGVHQTTISNWLSEKSTPRSEMLPKIAAALEVSEIEFVDEDLNYLKAILSFLQQHAYSDDEIQKVMSIVNSVARDAKAGSRISVDSNGSVSYEEPTEHFHLEMNLKIDSRTQLLEAFDSMNETGQKKAVENVEDLAKIPEYQKDQDEE